MVQSPPFATSDARRGVILMVVLALLTLFAIVGLSFVLYADSAARSAQLGRTSEVPTLPDLDAEHLAAYFLGQLIFDTGDDVNGVFSALRGHSLARSMYGYYYRRTPADPDIPNTLPFNGTGRWHTHDPKDTNSAAVDQNGLLTYMNPFKVDDFNLVNYMYFPSDLYPNPNSPSLHLLPFLRDPERVNPNPARPQAGALPPWRTDPSQPPGNYVGGFNAPYTYPDLNNLYLGAVKADGTVMTPSYHRPWLFGPLQNTTLANLNPNWIASFGKYMTLRPRPIDQLTQAQVIGAGLPWPLLPENWTPAQQAIFQPKLMQLITSLQAQGKLFPYPEDGGGDVKNLVGARGYFDGTNYHNNDSIWIDLGFPVMTAPNGKKFKPLFAPLIVDLDNRINLNVHGNIRGGGAGSRGFVANQSWGPWTVDVSQVLNSATAPQEWKQLFYGTTLLPNESRTGPYQPGRYGLNVQLMGTPLHAPTLPHKYAPVDYDECDANGQPTAAVPLQTGTNCFPSFPAGYDNYNANELRNHPSLYNVFQNVAQTVPAQRSFQLSDMEALLRFGDTGSPFLTSELLRLCPSNFGTDAGADQRRRMVTLRSYDVERPGAWPWLSAYQGGVQQQNNDLLPYGGPPPFTLPSPPSALTPAQQQQLLQNPNEFRLARVGTTNQYLTDWRSATVALGRVDLNRPLPHYPAPAANGVINDNDSTTLNKFKAAELARQQFAEDLYQRLISVTGVYNPFLDPSTHPLDMTKDVPALRALAQLAVNIVDLIDEDDYSTPFHWGAIGHPNFVKLVENAAQAAAQQTPQWVFGVELPHVVINEAYAQYSVDNEKDPKKPHNAKVEVWVELYNPLSTDPSLPNNGDVHLDRGYRLILARPATQRPSTALPTDSYLRLPDNVRGTPRKYSSTSQDHVYGVNGDSQGSPAIVDFVSGGPSVIAPVVKPSGGGAGPQGYFVMGPPAAHGPAIQGGTPIFTKPQMAYSLKDTDPDLINTGTAGAPVYTPAPPTIVLQRLACPYRPHNPLPNDPEFPGGYNPNRPVNPYITTDYFSDVNKDLLTPGKPISITSSNKKQGINPGAAAYSEGRKQPFAGHATQKVTQAQTPNKGPTHTFFSKNAGAATNFDWLVHLDRQLISPMELMHVAAVKPALLTQEFIHPPTAGGHMLPYNHRVPWYDEDLPATGSNDSHRLHRLFEFVATRSRSAGLEAPAITGQVVPGTSNSQLRAQRLSWLTASGVPASIKAGDVLVIDKGLPDSHENVRVQAILQLNPTDIRIVLASPVVKPHGDSITIELTTMGERVPGKININTVWDMPTFLALANPTTSHNYAAADILDQQKNQGIVPTLLTQRTPGLGQSQLTANDRPFLGMAPGHYSSPVPFYAPGTTNYGISGVNHTLLGPAQPGASATSKRLMQVPFTANSANPPHPFVANQLLTRLFNNVTTRSNVFAVWMTVGFFEVLDDTVRPVKLGAEIGKAENRQVRHRMFSIVDRSALTVPSAIGQLQVAIAGPGIQHVKVSQVSTQIPIGPEPPIGALNATTGRTLPQTMWWTLQPGDIIVVGEGTANQETVQVIDVDVKNNILIADFSRAHVATETVSVHVLPGNPGPVTKFNPRDRIYEEIIPYLSVIE